MSKALPKEKPLPRETAQNQIHLIDPTTLCSPL